jgi:hypothetical protein
VIGAPENESLRTGVAVAVEGLPPPPPHADRTKEAITHRASKFFIIFLRNDILISYT